MNSKEFGLPQNRSRLYVCATNVRDPQLFWLGEDRDIDRVCDTMANLYQVCFRKTQCAAEYLLEPDNEYVQAELSRLQEECEGRVDEGYDLGKAVKIAEKAGFIWGSFPPPGPVRDSEWFQPLTNGQKDRLCFSLAHDPRPHYFRDLRPSFGRTRHSSRADGGTGQS